MSKIEELINQYCPDGVKHLYLKDCCIFKRGSTITQKEAVEGTIPVIAGGKKPAYYHNQPNRQGASITVAGSGAYAGYVSYWEIPIYVSDAFTIAPKDDTLSLKYLYYYLNNNQEKIHNTKKGSGVPHVHPSSIWDFQIPLPPLPIQEKITEILDKFSLLTAELEAELDLQKKRYDYYRNRILSFDSEPSSNSVQWKPLGEIAQIGTGSHNTQDGLQEGKYPFYTRGIDVLRLESYDFDETAIITAGDGAGVGKVIHFVTGKYALHQRAYRIVTDNNIVIPRFLYQYMRVSFYNYIMKSSVASSVTSVRKPMLISYPIPIPPLAEQERIVNILDRFEALVTNLSNGLPAEIERVRKQYEYYRNKLLTFPIAEQ